MDESINTAERSGPKKVLRSISLEVRMPPESDTTDQSSVSEKQNSETAEALEAFMAIGQRFTTVLQLLWTYAHSVGEVAERTSLMNVASVAILLKQLNERESRAAENEPHIAEVLYCIILGLEGEPDKEVKSSHKVYDIDHFQKITDCIRFHDAALDILNDTVLQQIVNTWESCLGSLVAWYISSSGESIIQDESITYQEVMKFGTFDEVKRYVVDQQVDEFLKRKDSIEQLNYFREKMHADLSSHFDRKKDLAEIVLRRHAVVHASGRASSEYYRRAKKLDAKFVEGLKVGDSIRPTSAYIKTSWSVIYAAGVVLMHLIVKADARSRKSDEDEKRADGFLTQSAFTCIKERQYDAAEMILRYACNHHLKSEQSSLISKVNYAQTLKWMGRTAEAYEVLDSHDWSTCNYQFQLCVAAIRDDVSAFQDILPRAASDGGLSLNDMYDWPVFKTMRENEGFSSWVEAAFGMTLPSELRDARPKLFDARFEDTLASMKKFLGDSGPPA